MTLVVLVGAKAVGDELSPTRTGDGEVLSTLDVVREAEELVAPGLRIAKPGLVAAWVLTLLYVCVVTRHADDAIALRAQLTVVGGVRL
jgi:hypothetical protein